MDKKNNKIIHYIWFGGNPISELTKKCIQSWKKFLPDFEIKEWNETNFDVNQCPFVKQAYEQKKWAFVADYTRFKVLEEYGGIYLDTDMEITADISKYLELDLFMGQEDSKMINAAVVWAKEAHNPHIKDIVNVYESAKMFNETGDLYEQSVPRVLTKYFEGYGFNKELDEVQVLDDGKVNIYPMEYFYPLSYDYQHNKFTDNSCMIHHFDATWISKMELFKTKMKRKNMKWVVYVIDFFINLKNKIKFFSNYRDVTIFIVMFVTMLLAMFSFAPITQLNQDIGFFESLTNNIPKAIVQILTVSLVWTFILAKIRNIDLNFYTDKLTNRNENSNEQKSVKLNLEMVRKLEKREKYIYVLQIIVTILLALCPVFEALVAVPVKLFVYGALVMLNIYFLYLGIKKQFLYRKLELVPYAIILALLIAIMPGVGILTSLFTFVYILFNLFKNKIASGRIKVFAITYSVALVLVILCGVIFPSLVVFEKLEFGNSILANQFDVSYNDYLTQGDIITKFDAGKTLFANNLKQAIESKILFIPNFYLIVSIILVLILAYSNKNKEYLSLGIVAILNFVYIMGIDSALALYLSIPVCAVYLVFLLENALCKCMDRE